MELRKGSNMKFETIQVQEITSDIYQIQMIRKKHINSLNGQMINELTSVLTVLEEILECRMIVLRGSPEFFCTGMDFESYVGNEDCGGLPLPQEFQRLLKQISLLNKYLVSIVEGETIAGGVGIVAASDYVICSQNATFQLTEAFWGLLPCMVLPYLMRRTGYWMAYQMTIMGGKIMAQEALKEHLIDEISEDMDCSLRQLSIRIKRIAPESIGDAKRYFEKMWFEDEAMEKQASLKISKLVNSHTVKRRIEHFVHDKKFPWEDS